MEPVTLTQIKRHLKMDLDYTLEDDELSGFVKSARLWCEKYTGLSFVVKRLQVYTDKCRPLEIPNGPVITIESVQDAEGNDIHYSRKGLIHPVISSGREMYVTFVAGFEDLPEDLKTAVKMLAVTLYENREDMVTLKNSMEITKVPFGVKDLLQPYSRSGGLFI